MLKRIFEDPRALLFIFLSTYAIYALITPGFGRNWQEFALTMSTCILVDYLFIRFYKKTSFFPTSGMITSFGIFLMGDAPYLWIYPLLAFIGIASKHLLAINNKHIFNPNNFALALGVLFLEDKMTIIGGRWGGHAWLALTIIALGIIVNIKANKLTIVLSFLASFILFAVARSYYLNVTLTWVFMPLTGPSFFLFVFYMLTDPRTTPNTTNGQISFGILLALIDAIFRLNRNKYAPILSLFIMCGTYPSLIQLLEYTKMKFVTLRTAN